MLGGPAYSHCDQSLTFGVLRLGRPRCSSRFRFASVTNVSCKVAGMLWVSLDQCSVGKQRYSQKTLPGRCPSGRTMGPWKLAPTPIIPPSREGSACTSIIQPAHPSPVLPAISFQSSLPLHTPRPAIGTRRWASSFAGPAVMHRRAPWSLCPSRSRGAVLVLDPLGCAGYSTCSKARRLWTRSARPVCTSLRSPIPFRRGLPALIKADYRSYLHHGADGNALSLISSRPLRLFLWS